MGAGRVIARFAAGLALAAVGLAAPAAPRVEVAGGGRPAVLESLELPDALLAFALSPDGRIAAWAVPTDGDERRSVLHVAGAATDTVTEDVGGRVRALAFDPTGTRLYALVHRAARRGAGATLLFELDPAAPRLRGSGRRVPTSATSLERWASAGSLLIAADDEIRTLRFDGLRSGPLFRVPGANLALANLATSDLLLVGQRDGIVLVRLGDPPLEDGSLPVRDRVAVAAPVVALAAAPDGTSALGRTDAGRSLRIGLGPLRLEESGPVAAIAATRPEPVEPDLALEPLEPLESIPAAEPPAPAPAPEPAGREPLAGDEPAAEPTPPDGPAAGASATAHPPRPAMPATPEPAGGGAGADARPPGLGPSRPPVAPPASDEPAPAAPGRVRGRLAGPEAGAVEAIVFYGPSSVLQEAARVRPGADGAFHVDGLEPGRYRIELEAAGDRVVVSEPAFAVIDLSATASVEVPEFRILRVYGP